MASVCHAAADCSVRLFDPQRLNRRDHHAVHPRRCAHDAAVLLQLRPVPEVELVPGARAAVMSLSVAAMSLGRAAGALAATPIWERGGIALAAASAALLTLLGLAALLASLRAHPLDPAHDILAPASDPSEAADRRDETETTERYRREFNTRRVRVR